jgi:phosphoribosylformylglycinamidine (FGAM) synthase-like enzyme
VRLEANIAPDRFLFSESAGRAIISVDESDLGALLDLADEMGVAAKAIGEVGGDSLDITCVESACVPVQDDDRRAQEAEVVIALPVAKLAQVYEEAIPCAMER